MRMLGKKRTRFCRYGCCCHDMRDGKKQVVRRNKRRERRFWKKEEA